MIPEGWTTATLEKIADPGASIRYGVVQIGANTPGGVPIVPIKYINQIGKVRLHLASPKIEGKYKNSRVQAGDVLISVKGTIGEVGIVPHGFSGNIAREIARIRPNGTVDAGYLAYQLQAPETRRRIKSVTVGTTRLEFSIAAVKSFEVALPPLNEQRRIAEILSTWHRAIETVEALIANARQQKKALMQSLLSGKKRLPGFSDEWRWIKFSDVFDRVRQKNDAGNTNVLTISAQHGLISQVEYFNKSIASEDVRGYTLLQRGDFAYNKSYSDGYPMGAIKPLERYEAGIVSSLYICFRLTKRGYHHAFFQHYFEAGLFNGEIASIAQEGARNHGLLNVSVVEFFETSLHIPKPEEQAAIAKVVNAAEAAVNACETQLVALRQERDALMQQLLTGERRVNLPESEIA